MVKAIIYTSNSGYTKQYAEILSKKLGLPVYSCKDAKKNLKRNTEVAYLGWILASGIKGYSDANKNFDIKAIGAVGMSYADEKNTENIKKRSQISDTPLFYMQGGFDINKLHGMYKLMMKAMKKSMVSSINSKEEVTEEDKKLVDMLINGGSCVSEENAKPMMQWLEENK